MPLGLAVCPLQLHEMALGKSSPSTHHLLGDGAERTCVSQDLLHLPAFQLVSEAIQNHPTLAKMSQTIGISSQFTIMGENKCLFFYTFSFEVIC